jgi:hypothetical protein
MFITMFLFGAIPVTAVQTTDAEPAGVTVMVPEEAVALILPEEMMVVPVITYANKCRSIMKYICLIIMGLMMLIGGIITILVVVLKPDSTVCEQCISSQ